REANQEVLLGALEALHELAGIAFGLEITNDCEIKPAWVIAICTGDLQTQSRAATVAECSLSNVEELTDNGFEYWNELGIHLWIALKGHIHLAEDHFPRALKLGKRLRRNQLHVGIKRYIVGIHFLAAD